MSVIRIFKRFIHFLIPPLFLYIQSPEILLQDLVILAQTPSKTIKKKKSKFKENNNFHHPKEMHGKQYSLGNSFTLSNYNFGILNVKFWIGIFIYFCSFASLLLLFERNLKIDCSF
jgi:hypothetical protein